MRLNVVKKVKKLALSIGFFNILLGKVVVVQTPEWKLKG